MLKKLLTGKKIRMFWGFFKKVVLKLSKKKGDLNFASNFSLGMFYVV